MIEIGGKLINLSQNLYKLLLTFNQREVYSSHYFDARFVLIATASYMRKNEDFNNGLDKDDPRIQIVRGNFLKIFSIQH